mmetsp:Transcript_34768/g.112173  ORF Transcript_34768/g.112173 Transcript_34768/m.112173 type:complete len:188 (+) Transcript_34768:1635-2198(+)
MLERTIAASIWLCTPSLGPAGPELPGRAPASARPELAAPDQGGDEGAPGAAEGLSAKPARLSVDEARLVVLGMPERELKGKEVAVAATDVLRISGLLRGATPGRLKAIEAVTRRSPRRPIKGGEGNYDLVLHGVLKMPEQISGGRFICSTWPASPVLLNFRTNLVHPKASERGSRDRKEAAWRVVRF